MRSTLSQADDTHSQLTHCYLGISQLSMSISGTTAKSDDAMQPTYDETAMRLDEEVQGSEYVANAFYEPVQ
jgi:hypothetical protein